MFHQVYREIDLSEKMADVPVVKISVLEGVYAQLNRLGFALPVVMALSELRASPADAEGRILVQLHRSPGVALPARLILLRG